MGGVFESIGGMLKRRSTQIVGTALVFFGLGIGATRLYDKYTDTPESVEPELEPEPEVEYAE